jgi:hypothetical protein
METLVEIQSLVIMKIWLQDDLSQEFLNLQHRQTLAMVGDEARVISSRKPLGAYL